MGIDIDKFLNNLSSEKKEEKVEVKEEKKDVEVELNFDKEVESKLKTIELLSKEQDLLQLKEIYEKIKEFDQNMPSKFLNVEKNSSETISRLNKVYSNKLLNDLKNNVKILTNKIENNLKLIEEDIGEHKFKISLKKISESKTLLDQFPNEFFNEKNILKNKIIFLELKIQSQIRNFSKVKKLDIRSELLKDLKQLENLVLKTNSKKIEEKILDIQTKLDTVPKLFRTALNEEIMIANKAIYKAVERLNYLKSKEFEKELSEIYKLKEKFQTYVLKKDLNTALLIYNEVLLFFQDLPDTNFEEKIKVLDTITSMHSQINNLYIKNNVEIFLRSFNNSKVIEEARDYLDQISITKQASTNNLNLILDKLKKLPRSTHIEQDELVGKYETLIKKIQVKKEMKSIEEFQVKTQDLEEAKVIPKEDLNSKKDLKVNIIIERAENFLKKAKEKKHVSLKDLNLILDKLKLIPEVENKNREEIIKKYSSLIERIEKKKQKTKFEIKPNFEIKEVEKEKEVIPNKIKIDKNLSNEIEELYQKLKNTVDKKEATILFKKIHFYMDLTNIPSERKELILSKVKKTYSKI